MAFSDHSLTFVARNSYESDKNTWADWHIIPASRPLILPPKPKYHFQDLGGADGDIDLTEALGDVNFSSREGNNEFVVMNEFWDTVKINWSPGYIDSSTGADDNPADERWMRSDYISASDVRGKWTRSADEGHPLSIYCYRIDKSFIEYTGVRTGQNIVLDQDVYYVRFLIEAIYKNTFSIPFYVNRREWADIYSEIMNYLQGQRRSIILEDDPWYIYTGRFDVNEWRSEKDWSRIVLNYRTDPYKYERFSSTEDWLWDPFPFEEGIIREYSDLVVPKNSNITITIPPTKKTVIPTFTFQAWGLFEIQFDTRVFYPEHTDGVIATYRNRGIYIKDMYRTTSITFVNHSTDHDATVSIEYRGGYL